MPIKKLSNTLAAVNTSQRLAAQMNISSVAQRLATQLDMSNLAKKIAAQMDVSNVAQRFATQMDVSNLAQKIASQMDVSSVAQRFATQMDMSNLAAKIVAQMDVSSVAQRFATQMDMSNLAKKITASIRISNPALLAIESISRSEAFHNSIATLAKPENLSAAIEVLNRQSVDYQAKLSRNDTDFDIQQLEEGFEKIASSRNHEEFNKNYANFPAPIQFIIFRLFLLIVLPMIIGISVNILTPHVQDYLSATNDDKRAKIKVIKNIGTNTTIGTMGLRFITGDNVRLRSGPSTSSEILDELKLGQIVTVLSKKRNWIEVQYSYKDSETLRGWVFTRYTANFK
jgi:hypothetical protein